MLQCSRPTPIGSIRRLAVIAIFAYAAFKFYGRENTPDYTSKSHGATSRHLLSAFEWEQCNFEIGHTRNYSNPDSWYSPASAKGWVALYCILILIVFVALAIICDDFFVPSLEAISEKLDLSEDVAGATFMAAGSSAPELFTSIVGVTVESDVGVGTIVGSAIFNLLGIVALSAAFAGQVLHLDWRPLTRDAAFYCFSICFFIIFAWDGKFEIYESVILLALYFLYILLMKFNPKLMEKMAQWGSRKVDPSSDNSNKSDKEDGTETIVEEDGEEDSNGKKRKFSHINKGHLQSSISNLAQTESVDKSEDKEDEDFSIVVCPCLPPVSADIPAKPNPTLFGFLRCVLSWILFLVSFPFVIMFTWTIPNCSTPQTKKYYLLSFFMSIAWIAGLSFAMVTLVGRAGCILEIDKFTMGLVVVAIGTSIPDALSSVLVARDGYGDMAVSNAIGSNVFDIDLGLGFPFLISSLIRNFEPVSILSKEEQVQYDNGEIVMIPHVKFGFILLLVLAMSLIVFGAAKFKLNKYLGLTFVIFYIIFVAYAYIQDLVCNGNC
ncbi:sodium/potassium/calcium exchanger 1-like [Clytia hemisphaerica]|uniref:Sodium/calcium exchanger membrane region domain-containing protein n=1 Tax=Clytia hemisphaerica TaxID=252671 RepID=A0A7M5VCJ0_9CNID